LAEKPINEQRRYLSYLLRLWQAKCGEAPLWRASLERPQTGERLAFANLAELFAFLEKEIGANPTESEHADQKRRQSLQYQNGRVLPSDQ
jgi:hypothetical protein